jgi:hypothetical protein
MQNRGMNRSPFFNTQFLDGRNPAFFGKVIPGKSILTAVCDRGRDNFSGQIFPTPMGGLAVGR